MNLARRERSARGSGAQLRAEILAATAELLARTGRVDAVSIREISKMVGVSAPSIYRHFSDKDQLIEAVVAKVFEDLEAAMRAATDATVAPMERLRQAGLAYVRFALEHPEQYRLATAPGEIAGAVDQVLGSGAFVYFAAAVSDCMAAGLIDEGDPVPVVLQLWSSAHGIASLLIAKPFLPWGDDLEAVADRVLRAACVGRVVVDNILGDDASPEDVTRWVVEQRQRK
ncbi:TetR/AcrR family transcriptional regulator [Nocardia australiensis]|uniref:TetR/AcrR family transcriptional regulator n=1 Tax=Nocardia australiensis TaxID=2887191 RepID=UPI001D1496EB|nr:TetR/AcrR family transcriptional regulator [Nocardia australiensis]